MEDRAVQVLQEGGGEMERRRNKYRRIRSRAREHYLQSCGYGIMSAKPPLPQFITSK